MSETLPGTVSALRQASEILAGAGVRLPTIQPGPEAFGAGAPGRLGELGRDLHRQFQDALDSRAREAQAHAVRLNEAAISVSSAVESYRDIDSTVRRHHPEVM